MSVIIEHMTIEVVSGASQVSAESLTEAVHQALQALRSELDKRDNNEPAGAGVVDEPVEVPSWNDNSRQRLVQLLGMSL